MGRSLAPASHAGDAADVVLQLAVLLEAGVAPMRAWEHLASAGQTVALRVTTACGGGWPLVEAIAAAGRGADPADPRRRVRRVRGAASDPGATEWADTAAAWSVATTVGAPLAPSLRSLAVALRDTQETADQVRIALAEPAGTARLMSWLPLIAVGLGIALGFDTIGVLVTNPWGIACLVAGVLLVLAARQWTNALARRASARTGLPGLGAELLAIALSGGVDIDRALDIVHRAGADCDAESDALLDLSRTAGVPAVELLRASAALARHRSRVEGRVRAARLSSTLLLPLGVCTLPAFLLLGVAPMLLSVVSTMTPAF